MTTATTWRTPFAVLLCGSLILTLALGIRQSSGLFLPPMSAHMGWGREVFSLAIAISNLVWGIAQPFTGAIADRYGASRVVMISALIYAGGLALMPVSSTGLMLDLTAGLLIGLGVSGCSFAIIFGVLGRAFPPEKRSLALGVASAGGSFGQFVMLPYAQVLISAIGWQAALLALAGTVLACVPLATALKESVPHATSTAAAPQSLRDALREAGRHRGFWLLTAGFFVCGWQVAFIMVHLPAFLLDRGMAAVVGMTALALIGLFNIAGSFVAGYLGGIYSKKHLLAVIYLARALIIGAFLWLPLTPWSVYFFAAAIGFLWLGTVPLTNGIVGQIFGVRHVSMLFGIVFLSHQVGSFLGVWLGGYFFDLSGSYNAIWMGSIALGLVAAALNLPIDDRPVQRLEMRAA